MNSIKNQEELINTIKSVHGDKYDLSKTIFGGWTNKVVLTCHKKDFLGREHGEFNISLANLITHKCGCPKCGGSYNYNTEDFIAKAKLKYGDYFTYEKTKYVNTNTKVIVTDKYGKDHEYRPDNFLGKRGVKMHEENYNPLTRFIEASKERSKRRSIDERPKRQEAFIEKAVNKYGNEYSYDKTYYTNTETKITITHKLFGDITVVPLAFLKDEKRFKNYRPVEVSQYTYKICETIAKNFKYLNDFKEKEPKVYRMAKKLKYIDNFIWLKVKRNKKDEERVYNKEHYVYAYIFKNNSVYVGRTYNPKKRDEQHRTPQIHSNGTVTKSAVLKHSESTNLPIPEMTILEKNLTLRDSCEKEDYWVNSYRNKGFNVLNKAKTGRYSGSIGGYIRIWDEDTIREKCNGFKNLKAFRKVCHAKPSVFTDELKDELFPNRMIYHTWTYEEAKSVCDSYESLKDFRQNEPHCYDFVHKRNWIKEWFPDYEKPRRNYWTYEKCKEEAEKYDRRSDFCKSSPTAYNVSRINNWLEEFFKEKESSIKKTYSYEECKEIAKQYQTKTELSKNNWKVYTVANENSWLNDFFIKYNCTYDECANEAKKYSLLTDFKNKSKWFYYAAKYNGWYADIRKIIKDK